MAHSLKGAATASDIPLIADVCHRLETLLAGARDGAVTLQPAHFAILFEAADAMDEASRILAGNGDLSSSRLSVLHDDLDARLDDAGSGQRQLTPVVNRRVELEMPAIDYVAEQRQTSGIVRIESRKLDSMRAAVEQMSIASADVLRRLADLNSAKGSSAVASEARTLSNAVRELEEITRTVQMRPFMEAVEMLPRVVRDIASETGKDAELEIGGGEVEADRSVIDGLREALLQLTRNAVDHAVELPRDRITAGKPPAARISIDAILRGDRLRVTVSDDGKGVAIDALRNKLTQLGRRVPDDDRALIEMLFEGGISTRAAATAISGRGVGLNLVHDIVTRMHGTITVDTIAGAGTTFVIECPLTLASVHALIVGVGTQRFAVPISSVRRVRRAEPRDIRNAEGSVVLTSSGKESHDPVPVVSLARVLGPPLSERPLLHRVPVVILESPAGNLAVIVDEVLSEREITIRRIDGRGVDLGRFIGASVLPGGGVALVINVSALVSAGIPAARGGAPAADAAMGETRRRKVLVVDDSITTRALEQSVLEAGGYETIAAVDGAAAWDILNEIPVDLVVADVEMPRMDGFSLCEAIRRSKKLGALPVVLVTALERPEHKARGLEAGADAYIVKSGFDQKTLLDTVDRMLR